MSNSAHGRRQSKVSGSFKVILIVLLIATVYSLIAAQRPVEVKEVGICEDKISSRRFYKRQNTEPAYRQEIQDLMVYQAGLNCNHKGKVIFELYK